jgi:CBS domain-containing protein
MDRRVPDVAEAELDGTCDATATSNMLMPSVSQFMTTPPVAIHRASTLTVARYLMQAHEIRHLPVVGDGRLVGIVSEHDVRLLEGSAEIDPDLVRVDQVMNPDPFIVTGDTALDEVTEIMAKHKYSSVIVMGRDGVEGIFTAVDACQALTTILRSVIERHGDAALEACKQARQVGTTVSGQW